MKLRIPRWLKHLVIALILCAIVIVLGPGLTFKGNAFLQSPIIIASVCGAILLIWALLNLKFKSDTTPQSKTPAQQISHEAEQIMVGPTQMSTELPLPQWIKDFPESKSLPILMILGESGAGKSRLLAESGDCLVQQTQYIDGQAIIWHLGQKLIAIECDDGLSLSGWNKLIKMLKPYRKRIAAVLYNLPATSVMANKTQMLIPLQQKWLELTRRLHLVLPLYVVTTQLDQLAGFSEFFTATTCHFDEHVFGVTGACGSKTLWLQRLEQELQGQVDAFLHQRLNLLNDPRPLVQQLDVYTFPSRFLQYSEQLKTWFEALLKQIQEVPAEVGVFLTAIPTENNSYFAKSIWPFILGQIQSKVHLAGAGHKKQIRHRTLALSLCGLLACGSISAYWYKEYMTQLKFLLHVQTQVNSHQPNDLPQLSQWIEWLTKHNLWTSGGLNPSQRLLPVLKQNYLIEFKQTINPMLQTWFYKNIPASDGIALYENTRAYLMLGDLTHRDPEILKNWFAAHPDVLVGANSNKLPKNWLNDYVAIQATLPMDNNFMQQAQARLQQLTRAQLIYLIVKDKAMAAFDRQIPLSADQGALLQQIFVLDKDQLWMMQMFTKNWAQTRFPVLRQQAMNEIDKTDWVIGNSIAADSTPEYTRQQVSTLYSDDYINEWQNKLNHLQLVKSTDLRQAANLAGLMAQVNSPLDSLLATLQANTNLSQSVSQSQSITIKKKTIPIVQSSILQNNLAVAFGPMDQFISASNTQTAIGYTAVKATLQQLSQQLNQLANQPASSLTAVQVAQAHFAGTATDPLQQLRRQLPYVPQPLQSWLQQLVDQSWVLILAQARQELNVQWQQQIVPVYQTTIAGRYPLYAGAKATIAVADFNQFFGKAGLLDQFYNKNLQMFINTDTKPWQWRNVDGAAIGFNDDLLRALQQADIVRQSFFAGAAAGVGTQIAFNIMPYDLSPNVAQVQLTIAGQTLTYGHGPQRYVTMNWPGTNLYNAVNWLDLNGQQYRNSQQDFWGLFRLLKNAQTTKQDGGYLVTLKQGPFYASFLVQANSAYNPFAISSLQFSLPNQLN